MEGAYLLRRGLFMPWELPSLLPPEIVREDGASCRRWPPSETLDASTASARSGGAETCWYMRNQLLRDSDWAGWRTGVEIPLPS